MEKDDIKSGLETAGYVFNPMISYEGDFSLNLPVASSDDDEFINGDYSLDNDILFLNSKVVDGKNMYEEFIKKSARRAFGVSPVADLYAKNFGAIVSTIDDNLKSRHIEFDFALFLMSLLKNQDVAFDMEFSEQELLDYVKEELRSRRKKIFNVIRLGRESEFYTEVIEELNIARQRLGVNVTLEQYSEQLGIFLRDVKYLDLKNKYVDVNALKECFDYHKLALLLAKMMLDNTKLTIKLEGMVHNCWQEVLTYINIVEDSTNKHYNPVIKYYNSKSRSIETFSFKDLKKEVAKIMASPVNYQTVSVSFDEAVSEGISYNADAASKYINDVLSERAKRELMASWEIIRKGERGELDESSKSSTTYSRPGVKKELEDFYISLMRRREIFEATDYEYKVIGSEKFAGYIGYVYKNGIVIFEKLYEDQEQQIPIKRSNATYVMNINNFVELSKLTKTEIIKFIKNSANPEVLRLYHSGNWAARLHSIINGKGYNSSVSKKIDDLLEKKEISKRKELRG